jgi:hypothetical protein
MCYSLGPQARTQPMAQQACAALGGQLATYTSPSRQLFVEQVGARHLLH